MFYLIATPVAFLAAIAGWILFRRGRRLPPDSTTPYCRRCHYNLTALASDRCPECGADVTQPRAIIKGVGKRAAWWTALGATLLVAGLLGAGIYGRIAYKRMAWYRYAPAFWLLRNAASDSEVWRSNGYFELKRRVQCDALSKDQTQRLIGMALDDQARWDLPIITNMAVTQVLEALDQSGAMNTEQRERYRVQTQLLRLAVRPTVPPGTPIRARIDAFLQTTQTENQRGEILAIRVDGQPIDLTVPPWRPFVLSMIKSTPFALPPQTPGRHVLECDVRTGEAFYSPDQQQYVYVERSIIERTLRAEFEVLAAIPAEYIKRTPSAELANELPGMIDVKNLYISTRWDEATRQLVPMLNGYVELTGKLPLSLAFDVIVRWDDGECVWSRCAFNKDEVHFHHMLLITSDVDSRLPPEFRVILRSSVTAAEETPDLYEIWDGEIDLGIKRAKDYEQLRKIEENNRKLRKP